MPSNRQQGCFFSAKYWRNRGTIFYSNVFIYESRCTNSQTGLHCFYIIVAIKYFMESQSIWSLQLKQPTFFFSLMSIIAMPLSCQSTQKSKVHLSLMLLTPERSCDVTKGMTLVPGWWQHRQHAHVAFLTCRRSNIYFFLFFRKLSTEGFCSLQIHSFLCEAALLGLYDNQIF